MQRPPDLTTFVPGDQQQLMQLRNFVASVSPLVKKYDTLLADFVAIDLNHPTMQGWNADDLLDVLFFGSSSQVIKQTWVQGRKV